MKKLLLIMTGLAAAQSADISGERIRAHVKFLASDDASYITGHVLKVNGGMYM